MRRRTWTTAVAGAAVATALVGGCSVQPGTAMQADGRTVSQAEVSTAAEQLSLVLVGAEPTTVLVALIAAPYFIDAAEENGVGVSTTQARQRMDEVAGGAGATDLPDWSEESVDVVRFSLSAQALQTLPDGAEVIATVAEEVLDADVVVNPRYGEFSQETGAIEPLDLPWIGGPAAGDTVAPPVPE